MKVFFSSSRCTSARSACASAVRAAGPAMPSRRRCARLSASCASRSADSSRATSISTGSATSARVSAAAISFSMRATRLRARSLLRAAHSPRVASRRSTSPRRASRALPGRGGAVVAVARGERRRHAAGAPALVPARDHALGHGGQRGDGLAEGRAPPSRGRARARRSPRATARGCGGSSGCSDRGCSWRASARSRRRGKAGRERRGWPAERGCARDPLPARGLRGRAGSGGAETEGSRTVSVESCRGRDRSWCGRLCALNEGPAGAPVRSGDCL